MGINFSRVLTLKYGRNISNYLHVDKTVISVGRVMTCVLGMIVGREREIREFVPTPFYRVVANMEGFDAEWRAVPGSLYDKSPLLYKENGFNAMEINMQPLHCIDSEYKAMYLALREVHMNYDE